MPSPNYLGRQGGLDIDRLPQCLGVISGLDLRFGFESEL